MTRAGFISRFLLLLAFTCAPAALQAAPEAREYIVVSGGPAMRYFEKDKVATHDRYWGNFIGTAISRLKQLKAQEKPGDKVTWLVYRPAYVARGKEEKVDLIADIKAKATAAGVNLLWFDRAQQLINYLNTGNNRKEMPIASFDFFGHSNKACFMFDYSNDIDGMSIESLHAQELRKIDRRAFAKGAVCKSWGCHSGEYYSAQWKKYLGVPMEGAVGKTDYSSGGTPFLSSQGGRWVQ